MSYNDLFQIDATMVANEFIDQYMPQANGDYVKVYLYLLKNRVSGVEVERIAEELHLTEGDVKRAIRYWEDQGIVSLGEKASEEAAGQMDPETVNTPAKKESAPAKGKTGRTKAKSSTTAGADRDTGRTSALDIADEEAARQELRNHYRRTEGKEALGRLGQDEEFAQLLIIVQTYCSKILSERETQVLAYLYDGLKLPADVLDYLVAYCVEKGHSSMRYIETVGQSWADQGIFDVAAAKKHTKAFDKTAEERSGRRKTASMKQGMTRDDDPDLRAINQIIVNRKRM